MRLHWAVLLTVFATSIAMAGGNSSNLGNRMVLATYWGDDKVALIDLQGEPGHEEVWAIDTLKAAACSKPYDVRVNATGELAYVSCSGGDQIAVIDVVAQQIRYTLKTGYSPRDLAIYDGGKRLIVANSGSDTVSVIDLENRKKLYDVPVSNQPYGVAVTKDNLALVTGWASGDLHFIELGRDSGKDAGAVQVGLLPYTVVIPSDSSSAYVAANADHHVAQVDLKSRTVVNKIKVGRNPWSLAASADGRQVLVTNNRSNSLSVLRTDAMAPTQTLISAGAQIQSNGAEVVRAAKNVSVALNGKSAAFTDLANNQIVLVDLDSKKIVKAINVGKAPYGIEYLR